MFTVLVYETKVILVAVFREVLNRICQYNLIIKK